MANSLIVLDDPNTVVTKFKELVQPGDKVLFVVLGNSPSHKALATKAQNYATKFRYAVQVTAPENLLPYLNSMPCEIERKPAQPWFSLSVSFEGYIAAIYKDDSDKNIVPGFLLAEY